MVDLTLQLLGSYRGRIGAGQELRLPTKRAWALLSYLALHPDQAISREKLAALFWGERFEEQARSSLRQTLYELRSALGADLAGRLTATRSTVCLSSDSIAVDALQLERLAASKAFDDLALAAELYSGDLLDSLEIGGSDFSAWLEGERTRFRNLVSQCLERLAASHLQRGEPEQALDNARRLIAINPLHEPSHRLVMQALAQSGRRSEALKHYQDLELLLKMELAVAPDGETQALRAEIAAQVDLSVLHTTAKVEQPQGMVAPIQITVKRPIHQWLGVGSAVLLLIIGIGVYAWQPWASSVQPALIERMTYPLSDRPSLAVMPFDHYSGNEQDGFIAKGFTEDLITALSQLPQLFVTSRTAARALKAQSPTPSQIAEQLSVRYIIEGSIQRSGEQLRITAQLIDAIRGRYLWADNFDATAQDLFTLQDDIVRQILIELDVKLTSGDHARVASRGTRNLDAWLLRQQAMAELYKFTRESTIRTRKLLQAAHEMDPDWARPLAGIAWSYWWEARQGWTDDREAWIRKGMVLAEQAIAKDSQDTIGYMQLGNLYQLAGDHRRAIELREQAVAIAPNDFQANWGLGAVLFRAGQAERAVEIFKHAQRVSPRHPVSFSWVFAQAQLLAGHYEDAIETASYVVDRAPKHELSHLQLAAAYSGLGRRAEAKTAAQALLRIDPGFNVTDYIAGLSDYQDQSMLARLADLLRQAGLPE